ncbi:hypothetical protein CF335_g9556, partial [Tilletia laevis]
NFSSKFGILPARTSAKPFRSAVWASILILNSNSDSKEGVGLWHHVIGPAPAVDVEMANPHEQDMAHDQDALDDIGLDIVNLSEDEDDTDAMGLDDLVANVNVDAIAQAAEHVVTEGDQEPPRYHETAFFGRFDELIQTICARREEHRSTAWAHVRRGFSMEIEREIEAQVAYLHARINSLNLRPPAHYVPPSERHPTLRLRPSITLVHRCKNKFRRTDFYHMPSGRVRFLACALVAATNGITEHPIIKRNTVYSSCVRRF